MPVTDSLALLEVATLLVFPNAKGSSDNNWPCEKEVTPEPSGGEADECGVVEVKYKLVVPVT